MLEAGAHCPGSANATSAGVMRSDGQNVIGRRCRFSEFSLAGIKHPNHQVYPLRQTKRPMILDPTCRNRGASVRVQSDMTRHVLNDRDRPSGANPPTPHLVLHYLSPGFPVHGSRSFTLLHKVTGCGHRLHPVIIVPPARGCSSPGQARRLCTPDCEYRYAIRWRAVEL